MRYDNKQMSVRVLQLAVGLVILIESTILAFNYKKVAGSIHLGLPHRTILVLACVEIIAAVLFIIPPTVVAGAWALLAVFLVAAVIHIAHGQFDIGALLVLALAVIVVMVHRGPETPSARPPVLNE